MLAKALIDNDENVFQLTRTFFPPTANSPEFVDVTYNFTETLETQTWYWSVSTSNFIHPQEVLQFMSLYFTKAYDFFSGDLKLTLSLMSNTSIPECAQDLEKMQLLTQHVGIVSLGVLPYSGKFRVNCRSPLFRS